MDIVWSMLPVVVVVALGYVAVKYELISQAANEGLTRFVFVIALPAMIFRNMATANLASNADFIWRVLAAYYVAALAIMVIGIVVGAFLFRMGKAEQSIFAVGASHSNLILLGVPAVLILLDGSRTQPLFMIVGLHGLLMAVILTTVSRVRARKWGEIPKAMWQSFLVQARNPIFVALALGVIYGLLIREQYELPAPANDILKILSNVVIPASLFGLGGMMIRYKFGGQGAEAIAVSALKLAAFPFFVWLFASQLGLNNWAWVAAMLATMPVGFNMANMASRSQNGAAMANTTTVMSTVLAIVAVFVLLYLRSG